MMPFQVTALLLLAAIMGVVLLGKKNIAQEKGNPKL
jgi:NADH:ubiquinone oxidoreductase subunit 6 (subunit J)